MIDPEKNLDLSGVLEHFETQEDTFNAYLNGFEQLRNLEQGNPDKIEHWFPPINPLAPTKTSEFMAIHRDGIFCDTFCRKSPSTSFFSRLKELPKLNRILPCPNEQATFQCIYDAAHRLKDTNISEYCGIIRLLLDDLEKRTCAEIRSLLEDVVDWGEGVLEREWMNRREESEVLERFQQSIKAIKIYSLLQRLVTTRYPFRLFEKLVRDIFPFVHALAALFVKEPVDLRERQRSMAADTDGCGITENDLEFSWMHLEAFFEQYGSTGICRPDKQIREFCDPEIKQVRFNCLFVDKMMPGKAVVKECSIRALEERHGKKNNERINFHCLSLDSGGINHQGTDIGSTVEKAVVGAYWDYRRKKETKEYKRFFDREVGELKTVFYSIGDVLEDYDGESIGAASYTAALSLFSGRVIRGGVYFTGKIDNTGGNATGVCHVLEKTGWVQQQPVPKGECCNILVMPESNFVHDLKGQCPRGKNRIEIRVYERNDTLFDLWLQLTQSGKKCFWWQLSATFDRDQARNLLSDEEFEKRKNSIQGRLINGLLCLISVMAPYEDVRLKTFSAGTTGIQAGCDASFIDADILPALMSDSDGQLSRVLAFLEKRQLISGDAEAFVTNSDVLNLVRHHLSYSEQTDIARLFEKLVYASIPSDPQGNLIPHIHEWVNFVNDYRVKRVNRQRVLLKLADFHLANYYKEVNTHSGEIAAGANVMKIRQLNAVLIDYIRGCLKNPDPEEPVLSDKLLHTVLKIRFLTEGLSMSRCEPLDLGIDPETDEPDRTSHQSISIGHQDDLFNVFSSFQQLQQARKRTERIYPCQPHPEKRDGQRKT